MSNSIELVNKKDTKYSKVSLNQSNHGQFSIEDEEDDEDIEVNLSDTSLSSDTFTGNKSLPDDPKVSLKIILSKLADLWSTLTFSWMRPLLQVGNQRALEMRDLYPLSPQDSSEGVYRKFKHFWSEQLHKNSANPSLVYTIFHAFGKPFMAAGGLKLIHDTCIFAGPYLLNALIKFLNDPSQPTSTGMWYVLGLFIANLTMSICLRQYFWWCYRSGMNLRSAVVTAVYSKSLVISAATMSRKSTGEISNLMSVDSSRLGELTPYLHAIWYSFYQIAVALYFLWQQMGVSCLAGIAVIFFTIPLTGKVSLHMKTLQKALSKVRDERIKLSNEVLSGMKVIKLQAWEREFQNRIIEVRERELALFRKYSIAQSLSGALFATIPIFVSIVTFITYIALGNSLDVATALTSLALFDLLRFPLFMFPNVLNSVVEARVSVDRVQAFLLEPEKKPVRAYPLTTTGLQMKKATLVWEGGIKKRAPPAHTSEKFDLAYLLNAIKHYGKLLLTTLSCGRVSFASMPQTNISSSVSYSAIANPLSRNNSIASSSSGDSAKIDAMNNIAAPKPPTPAATVPLTDAEFLKVVQSAQIAETERLIADLESEVRHYKAQASQVTQALSRNGSSTELSNSFLSAERSSTDDLTNINQSSGVDELSSSKSDATFGNSPLVSPVYPSYSAAAEEERENEDLVLAGDRILTLSRISLKAQKGQLISVVGQVGSGKSSVLSALLGNMRNVFGQVSLFGSVAYSAQIPFIQNSSLRDNILFGSDFDGQRYYRTLEECALVADIQMLPAGDSTEIGERGINLSGGQKARVSLARAVYADADIYLLDDPLSAVDAHVGQHLFEQCILHLKERNKCVVLVTNALQFLKHSSHIVVLKDGKVSEEGNYADLLREGRGFSEMISTMQETGSSNATGNAASTLCAGLDGVSATKSGSRAGSSNNLPSLPMAKVPLETVSLTSKEDAKKSPTTGAAAGANNSAQLITTEEREVGNVDFRVYLKWATAAGGWSVGFLIIFAFCLGEAVSMLANWWLAYWSENRDSRSPWYFLGIYIVINVGVVIFMLSRELYLRLSSLGAGRSLFSELLTAVLYAPMSFYDTTPLGRIINRFSKDIYTIDEQIPQTVRGYLSTITKVVSILLYISIVTPLFLVGLAPICAGYVVAQRYYIETSRELTRLESTSRSPIYALFSETLDGLSTIRAYNCEKRLVTKNNTLLDNNQRAYFLNFSANCWLAVRLEFAGTLIVTFAALFAVMGRNSNANDQSDTITQDRAVFAGLAGLSISLALSVTQSLNWTVRMASDMESQMVSVERVKTYASMPQEKPHYSVTDPTTAHATNPLQQSVAARSSGSHWPSAGGIEFHNVTMRYREGLPLVLNGLTFRVQPRQKIGIVGRTGAGKSSIVTALLRLVELSEGEIVIDNVNIATIGLNTLRSIMAVIPQDPVLFSGTIRSNLDPFSKYSDSLIWESLQRTLLQDCIKSLEDPVNENGSNFSVGQRQLLCIARALLSRARIIIMDEATAAVDVETDAVIQRTIRTEFADATCLTVAHRLNTILDSDMVLVMDAGLAAEFDTPQSLLANENSMFYSLVSNWENSK